MLKFLYLGQQFCFSFDFLYSHNFSSKQFWLHIPPFMDQNTETIVIYGKFKIVNQLYRYEVKNLKYTSLIGREGYEVASRRWDIIIN